ncbi:hypothetical protein LUZ61_000128 [Rhynchospora tenuis]|uniref:glutathione transferase n=1 Tax=Rhynchospora tenuis TaxID=198213 RepID=A0AAD5ZEJ7_9POAL|nr:hypothetical protein LUZ61_000128 [Rhynchospora tenuis]
MVIAKNAICMIFCGTWPSTKPTKKSFSPYSQNQTIAARLYKESGADLLPVNSAKFETWLQVESSQFYPAISAIIFELFYKPMFGMTTDMSNVEKEAGKLSAVLDVYEAHLAKNKYMAGDLFTLADLNHMPEIFLLLKTSKAELITSKPHVKAWWDDISTRPAWKKTTASLPV